MDRTTWTLGLAARARPPGRGDVGPVLLWLGVLIGLAIIGGVVMMLVRRRVLARDQESQEGLMESLRKMRDSGVMSRDEYDAARRSIATKLATRLAARPTGKQDGRP